MSTKQLATTSTTRRPREGLQQDRHDVPDDQEIRIWLAWVDTCCIDENSSAELSEALNSVLRWYEKAAVCYVYLSDLLAGAPSIEAVIHEA